MLTDKVLFSFIAPTPRQVLHLSLMIWPVPEHTEHVCWTEKKPCCIRTCPAPLQFEQVIGLEPLAAPLPLQSGHSLCEGILIFF